MINLSVKSRAFLLALVPMLLITVILSLYFIRTQLDDFDKAINDHGNTLAIHLSHASEFGIFSGNKENLTSLLHSSLEDDDVVTISVFDKTGNLFVREPDGVNPGKFDEFNSRTFRHPIVLHTTDVNDIQDIDIEKIERIREEYLGWLEVVLSTSRLDTKRNKAVQDASFIIFIGLLSSILLALWMAKSLTDPIIRLTNAVNRVEEGHLDEEINISSSGEIGFLEKGFMSMLKKIRITQQDLQDRIDETTQGLKNSLSIVEKQNIELTEARTKALESSQAKSRFLANISHELRTPMNGILGFSKLLKDSNLSDKQKDYVDTIGKSANNLLNLIDDILNISRSEAGKLQIYNETFNLYDCISDVITLLTPSINEKNLEIIFHYYEDTPKIIHAPFERIRQVLTNFLGNAIKFSQKGNITIRVMLDPDEDKLHSILISVSDEGIGIPEDDIDRIFKPFTQIDETITRTYGGTGLGLAISKSIVNAIGGEVDLESTPGKGSKFWFTFNHYPDEVTILSSNNNNTQNKNSLTNINILVAEDNPINSKLITSILDDYGAKISLVSNGKDALSAFKENDFDIILMDIQMPIMDGLDATYSIRNEAGLGKNIPIVGITANAIQEDINNYKKAGFNDILIKPITAERLVKEIQYWVSNSTGITSPENKTRELELFDSPYEVDITEVNNDRYGIKNELSDTLLGMLIDELPVVSKQLQESFTSQDWEVLRKQIHKLLGGISYCNTPDLKNVTQIFQTSLRNQSSTLESDFNNLIMEIEKLTNTKSP